MRLLSTTLVLGVLLGGLSGCGGSADLPKAAPSKGSGEANTPAPDTKTKSGATAKGVAPAGAAD